MSFDMSRVFEDDNDNKRGKFLSRVFGIFNEDIVRFWCDNPNSEYDNLGKPTLYVIGEDDRGKQIDITFKHKNTGEVYVGEVKCELQYQNYKYLQLEDPRQLIHHAGEKETDYDNGKELNWSDDNPFARFLNLAKNPKSYIVKVGGEETRVDGSILVWGSVTKEGKEKVREEFRVHVLSLEDMINELIEWEDHRYKEFINKKYCWLLNLMESLYGEQLECSK